VVSGLDFSAPAISAASSLAASLGLAARFVVSDVYDAVAAFGGQRFDIVYTGTGAPVWLPDIPRWTRVVAGLLAPGGFVYLVEGHPFVQILDSGPAGLVVAALGLRPA
jgi:SAM-dependent methyltransferase